MALPLALVTALNGSSYTIFLFLLLPITLSYSVLRWFDLGMGRFTIYDHFAMTAGNLVHPRCDASNASSIGPLFQLPLSRRLWDPGIRSNTPLTSAESNVVVVTIVRTLTTLLIALTNTTAIATTRVRAWDPGIETTMARPLTPSVAAVRDPFLLLTPSLAASTPWLCSSCHARVWDPGIDPAAEMPLAPTASMSQIASYRAQC